MQRMKRFNFTITMNGETFNESVEAKNHAKALTIIRTLYGNEAKIENRK
jgi:hypothetical protein